MTKAVAEARSRGAPPWTTVGPLSLKQNSSRAKVMVEEFAGGMLSSTQAGAPAMPSLSRAVRPSDQFDDAGGRRDTPPPPSDDLGHGRRERVGWHDTTNPIARTNHRFRHPP